MLGKFGQNKDSPKVFEYNRSTACPRVRALAKPKVIHFT